MNKILLVEDDHHLGIILKDQLEMHGYEVSLLRLPKQVVTTLQGEKFDLLIMDKLLSGVDGTHICADVRQADSISDTRILMMSGMDGARQVCLRAGATNFIPKPFDVNSLLASIEATLNTPKNIEA